MKMKVYQMKAADHGPKIVFAKSKDEARLIGIFWQVLNGVDPVDFTLDKAWQWSITIRERVQIMQACEWCVSGIGRQRSDGSWVVEEPRDERE